MARDRFIATKARDRVRRDFEETRAEACVMQQEDIRLRRSEDLDALRRLVTRLSTSDERFKKSIHHYEGTLKFLEGAPTATLRPAQRSRVVNFHRLLDNIERGSTDVAMLPPPRMKTPVNHLRARRTPLSPWLLNPKLLPKRPPGRSE